MDTVLGECDTETPGKGRPWTALPFFLDYSDVEVGERDPGSFPPLIERADPEEVEVADPSGTGKSTTRMLTQRQSCVQS